MFLLYIVSLSGGRLGSKFHTLIVSSLEQVTNEPAGIAGDTTLPSCSKGGNISTPHIQAEWNRNEWDLPTCKHVTVIITFRNIISWTLSFYIVLMFWYSQDPPKGQFVIYIQYHNNSDKYSRIPLLRSCNLHFPVIYNIFSQVPSISPNSQYTVDNFP